MERYAENRSERRLGEMVEADPAFLQALEAVRGATGTVARLEATSGAQHTISDPGSGGGSLLLIAFDADGERVAGAILHYVIEDDGGTGASFIVAGSDTPVPDSYAISGADGVALPGDQWRPGRRPGRAKVRVTVLENDVPVSFEFTREYSDRIPTYLTILDGGDQVVTYRPGERVDRSIHMRLRDERGQPVSWGRLETEIYDPNGTGTGRLVVMNTLDTAGEATNRLDIVVGTDMPGKSFYLRAYRRNYPRTTVDIECRISGESAS